MSTPDPDLRQEAFNREGQFNAILAELTRMTGAIRTTVRLDVPVLSWSVNTPCAEVLARDVRSMRSDASIDHRRARSIRWIERHRETLIQEDVHADAEMAPPSALSAVFGTQAQMVAPLIMPDGYMIGWVSAHFADCPRRFTPEDRAAIEAAAAAVIGLTQPYGTGS